MTKQSPKVSIGMPVYNMENTVQEAIDTILNQTFSDFELIISDNKSDDGTGEICRAAAKRDSRVIYHRNSENIYGENFRLLVLLSKGKYFMWAAADDSRKPEMVARCVEALEANPAAVLAYTHTELLNPETGESRLYYDQYRLDQEDPTKRYESLVWSLDLGNLFYGLYRRSVLFKIPQHGRNSYRNILFADSLFLTNLVFQGKVIQIPEMLFIRRSGKGESWPERLALYERGYNNLLFYSDLTRGVTLPVSEGIQEHVRYLLASALPVETKLRLILVTYEAYVKRYGNALSFEIDRAVNLAKEGKFTETWNGMPEPHPDEIVQNQIDKIYAGLLLDSLERTSVFIQNHEGLHLGKSFCLAKMGRAREADLQLELYKELVSHKAIDNSKKGK